MFLRHSGDAAICQPREKIMTGPIAQLVKTSVRISFAEITLRHISEDEVLIQFEVDYVADIARRIGASVTRSVRASVADSCATAGI